MRARAVHAEPVLKFTTQRGHDFILVYVLIPTILLALLDGIETTIFALRYPGIADLATWYPLFHSLFGDLWWILPGTVLEISLPFMTWYGLKWLLGDQDEILYMMRAIVSSIFMTKYGLVVLFNNLPLLLGHPPIINLGG